MMKKMIFALVALMVALPMVAQDYKINHDNTNSDGHRIISCEYVIVRSFSDRQVFNVALGADVSPSVDGTYNTQKYLKLKVVTMGKHIIPANSLLLVKNVDGEVLELRAMNEGNAMVRESVKMGTSYVAQYYASVFYPITEQDLEFLKKGIVKFRQETRTGKHEKEYKKEKDIKKITDVIINHDKLINEALATEKSFDSDF